MQSLLFVFSEICLSILLNVRMRLRVLSAMQIVTLYSFRRCCGCRVVPANAIPPYQRRCSSTCVCRWRRCVGVELTLTI